ncbi:MAG: glycosyltransferase [Flavobacterium sp.]
MQDKKTKIALLAYRLSGGGLEKVMSSLSLYFDKVGLDVHNIVLEDYVDYPYGGVLKNLGIGKSENESVTEKASSFFALKKYINANHFDHIVDFRYRLQPIKELLYAKFIFKSNTILTVHSSKINTYLPDNSFFTGMICDGKRVVCVSKKIQELVEEKHHLKNCRTIYNPIDLELLNKMAAESIDIDSEFIIAIGKYDENNVKQLDLLIGAYAKSILPKSNIKLLLLGTGQNSYLIEIAKKFQVENLVILKDFDANPHKYISKAKFLVFSSKYEGFGMVLVEALANKIPVISFDCIAGPNEIITHEQNGLLVENQDFEAMTISLNRFVEEKHLYEYCKSNAHPSIQRFSIEQIGQQWLDLLKIELNSSYEY